MIIVYMKIEIDKIKNEYIEEKDYKIKFRLLIVKLFVIDRKTGPEISTLLGIGKSQVYFWKDRYIKFGIDGLYDREGRGRPTKVDLDNLRQALQSEPIQFGYNVILWDVNFIQRYLNDFQDAKMSKSSIYRLLEEMGIKLHCDCLSCHTRLPSIKTKSGETISPLHYQVMDEVSAMIDVPIQKIITEKGIKPVLRLVRSERDRLILSGEAENGKLTLIYEETV